MCSIKISVYYGVMVGSYGWGKTKVLWNKSVPLPLCVPEILHGLKNESTFLTSAPRLPKEPSFSKVSSFACLSFRKEHNVNEDEN